MYLARPRRPALLTTDQVEALAEERTSGGSTIGLRDMKDDLLKAKHASYKDKGLFTVGCKPVNPKTARNFVQLAACCVRLVQAAPPESTSRETAGHSQIKTTSFALTVGGTSITPVKTRIRLRRGTSSLKSYATVAGLTSAA